MTDAELRHMATLPESLHQHYRNGTVRTMPDYSSGRDEPEDEQ